MDNKRKQPHRYNTRWSKRQKVEPQSECPKKIKKSIIRPICMLNYLCYCEIFDLLSEKDLISFGLTWKWAMQAAGHYFQKKFPTSVLDANNLQKFHEFRQFYQCISIDDFFDRLLPFQNEKSLQSAKFKQIEFADWDLSSNKVECIKHILQTVEFVKLKRCSIGDDFNEHFLKLCPNLKRLHMQHWKPSEPCLIGSTNDWLLRKHPMLEHLELTYLKSFEVKQLKEFFEMNPSVRSFAINAELLEKNVHVLMATDAKLDTLIVCNIHSRWMAFDQYRDVLNDLYRRGFYQRLHLYDTHSAPERLNLLQCPVEKLYLITSEKRVTLSAMPILDNVKELGISCHRDVKALNLEEVAKRLSHLEQMYISFSTMDEIHETISAFVRHSIKLTKIRIEYDTDLLDHQIRSLRTWQTERAKLMGARKVTIFVPEQTYLKTKWATKTIAHSMVEIKRANSYEWSKDYGFIQAFY